MVLEIELKNYIFKYIYFILIKILFFKNNYIYFYYKKKNIIYKTNYYHYIIKKSLFYVHESKILHVSLKGGNKHVDQEEKSYSIIKNKIK